MDSQFVTFNTFQPSAAPGDQENLVANWIQIMNPNDVEARGWLMFYGIDGAPLGRQYITVSEGGREDFSAHRFGAWKVGLVEWIPENPDLLIHMRNVRYYYDNAGIRNRFSTAYQLEAHSGSGELLAAPVDTRNNEVSVLELSNTLAETAYAEVRLYNERAEQVAVFSETLRPKSSRHLVLNQILGAAQRGVVTVRGSALSSVLAVVMQYGRNARGNIDYIYGIDASPALGSVIEGSYNTLLGQRSVVVLVNPTGTPQSANLSIVANDGKIIATGQQTAEELTIPPHGILTIDVTSAVGANSYGVITVVPENGNALLGYVLRSRDRDYVLPTPLLQ